MPTFLIAAALAAGASSTKVASAKSAPAAIESFDARILAVHNQERQRVGVKPLSWSPKLAADAAVWARHLAATDTFDHAPDRAEGDEQGENLWMGSLGAYPPEAMVGAWVEERRYFKTGLFPNVSTTGNWADVGHYTQLIWHNSLTVGCARAANRFDEYLVCRYGPPGNWTGEYALGHAPATISRAIKVKKRP
jgi:Cysteine-rich secretory protein family